MAYCDAVTAFALINTPVVPIKLTQFTPSRNSIAIKATSGHFSLTIFTISLYVDGAVT